jgi:hypothetical protein
MVNRPWHSSPSQTAGFQPGIEASIRLREIFKDANAPAMCFAGLGEIEQFGFDGRVLPGGSRAYVRLAWLPAQH